MERLFRRNENENDELVSKLFIGVALFLVLILVLCKFGIFRFDLAQMLPLVGIGGGMLIIPALLIYAFHVHTAGMKYLLILELTILMGVSYYIFTFQMIIFFVLPMLVAMLYMNKKVLYFAGVVTFIVLVISHIISAFHVLQPWIEPFIGLEDVVRYDILPRTMQLGVCFTILLVTMNRMLSYFEQYESIKKEDKSLEQAELNKLIDLMTDREKEVFLLMVQGKTNVQIAEALFLSPGTVKNYVSSIYDKTEIRDRSYFILKYGRFIERYDQSNIIK